MAKWDLGGIVKRAPMAVNVCIHWNREDAKGDIEEMSALQGNADRILLQELRPRLAGQKAGHVGKQDAGFDDLQDRA